MSRRGFWILLLGAVAAGLATLAWQRGVARERPADRAAVEALAGQLLQPERTAQMAPVLARLEHARACEALFEAHGLAGLTVRDPDLVSAHGIDAIRADADRIHAEGPENRRTRSDLLACVGAHG